MRVIIVGAGGHGQVVADILLTPGRPESVEFGGFVDDKVPVGTALLGWEVLGSISQLSHISHDAVVVAIGENSRRAEIVNQLQEAGERLISAVHPSAVIGLGVTIEPGAMVCAGVVINTGSYIGKSVIVNTGATVDHHSIIEDFAHIAPGVHMGGEVTIRAEALVGIGAVVLPRRTVGARSTVGAGAVVTSDVPDNVCFVGAPAKLMVRTRS